MTARQPLALPKKGSAAFKAEWARLLKVLDLPRLCVVLEGALDRRQLEELLRKALKGKAIRPGSIDRAHLVAAVAELVVARADVAFGAMRALDKSCHKERHIVASMDEDGIEVRLKSYRAIDFRRERARLIWALLRDGRDAPAGVAGAILAEHFEQVAKGAAEQEQNHPRIGEEPDENSFVRSLKRRVATYEEAIEEQAEVLHKEKSEREQLEEERSQLMVKVGQQQRALKAEEQRRKAAEDAVRELKAEMAALSQQLERADPERVQKAEEERDRLREKARALERKVEHAEQLAELRDETVALSAELEEQRALNERQRFENAELLKQLGAREKAAQRRVADLRDSLKTARQLAARSSRGEPSLVDGEPAIERVGLFVDAANVSASARREGQQKVDFIALLEELVGERQKTVAVAFVVERADADGFSDFCRSLSRAGYDVRIKRPKIRADGSKKADWDMGIAMEILDCRSRLDTVILASGDGDFMPLLRKLRTWGKRVEVASYAASTDAQLIKTADEHHDLSGRFRVT
jgi:uncharacterized LabA/DUF88 family protein/flagellar biosynthesis GTPase FlhF